MNKNYSLYRLVHNTWTEAVRIAAVEAASILLALATIPWRLLRRRKL